MINLEACSINRYEFYHFCEKQQLTVSLLSIKVDLWFVQVDFTSMSVVGMGCVVLFTEWLGSLGLYKNPSLFLYHYTAD